MAQPQQPLTTEERYLSDEQASLDRHEFIGGRIYAMAGATDRHALITGNTFGHLFARIDRRKCAIFQTDKRVRNVRSSSYFYPDIVVVCGKREFDANDNLMNPLIIIEVLSPGTATYDRGDKFKAYRANPALQAYVLIEQDTPLIEVHQRETWGWAMREFIGLDTVVALPSIDCKLALADVYENITFPPQS